jgi:hypothetical protein
MSPARLLLCLLCAIFALRPLQAAAQARPDHPFRADLSASGGWVSGNVGQAQATAAAHLSHSAERLGYDLLGSTFRLWIRPAPAAPLIQVGDTLAVSALPFWYLGERPYLLGVARYEHSQLRGVGARVNGGASVGVAPVRREDRLLRVSLGAQVEHTQFDRADLDPAWVEDGAARTVPRAALQSNGWLRLPGKRVSARYVGGLWVHPALPRDLRAYLDASTDLTLVGAVSLRASVNVLHDSVVPAGVQPTDLRANLGLAYKTPAPTGP